MFSIAAINDTESRCQCDPLAPTKEAQEFYITQSYHEGLLKLQAKDYENAREILESVLKDPLVSGAQVDGCASDGHLLQLRFLALKNLATVFLQQGPCHFESALHCYLQAVEIDAKDSVVWNQLGTLSCSMDFLSISRWAFEQGLVCSPNNWNCMEKLLEVLIAIGDEVACLSLSELILRHWPSHSRAFHVKKIIKESVPNPFSPRGIDNLKPIHARLKFGSKRKSSHEIVDGGAVSKKMNQNEELHLADVSWGALVDALLIFFSTFSDSDLEQCTGTKCRSGNTRLSISLPTRLDKDSGFAKKKSIIFTKASENITLDDSTFEKPGIHEETDSCIFEEQSQERRSTRLERLKNQRQGKDDQMLFANNRDLAKAVIKCLEPFIVRSDSDFTSYFSNGSNDLLNFLNNEATDVEAFVRSASKNYGAYHLSHLLLEEVAIRSLPYQDYFVKLFEIEKFTRNWGLNRSPECCLFFAELYYDFGLRSFESEFMSDVSYHLCKIIENIALDCPYHLDNGSYLLKDSLHLDNGSHLLNDSVLGSSIVNGNLCSHESLNDRPLFDSKCSFWVRFYWLSGQLSSLESNREKAHEEFCISLLLLTTKNDSNKSLSSVQRPHCKVAQQLTPGRILQDINLLGIDFLLKGPVIDMMDRGMHSECINMLAPLLFPSKDVHVDFLPKGSSVSSVELSALDIILKLCEKTRPMNTDVSFNCHYRRLQILMVGAGMEERIAAHKPSLKFFDSKALLNPDSESQESPGRHYIHLISEEVKAISKCASQKDSGEPCTNYNGFSFPIRSIGEIQSLLVVLMYNIASRILSNKSSGLEVVDQAQIICFINAAIGFYKLHHLSPTIPVKSHVELIMAIHDLLAEYGLCCAGEDGEVEEGTFLKLAIKHLLALDTKLKPSLNEKNSTKLEEQIEDGCNHNTLPKKLNVTKQNVEFGQTESVVEEDIVSLEGTTSKCFLSHGGKKNKECVMAEKYFDDPNNEKCGIEEIGSNQCTEYSDELTQDEREELELALDQCFFCLYGLNLRSDPSYIDDLVTHRNTSRGEYQTKEQCADVFQYILPYAKASSKTGLLKLRRVLRAIWKHFPQPTEDILTGNAIDKFLDGSDISENKLTEAVGSSEFLDSILKMVVCPDNENLKECTAQFTESSKPFFEVYCNLYYLLAQSEEMSATDKWPGFVLTKEGEEFVEQNVKLFKYDLMYNPLRFESWKRLAHIYDEEVDLLLNDGSKHINVLSWNKNATLSQRVDTSRRRSRRCLLMSLALAKSPVEQCEMHELLALVYYDSLQNVVPLYDQRSVQPSKDEAWMMLCRNSKKHFEEAFSRRQDWSHTFYLGKLSEKLGCSHDMALSYYDKSITLNPSAVDPVYRMHASRLKLLFSHGKQDVDTMKVVAAYSFNQSTKETVMSILDAVKNDEAKIDEQNSVNSCNLEKAWNILYTDSLSALQTCIEGDLKHFHKARYRLAQGLYTRHESEYLQSSKNELSFCFKSSRSSFTVNMWEIDGMVKKGRRRAQGPNANKKSLEVNLPESSRKFITCIRKYMLFYLKILEENEDIHTLERAYTSLRTDKRFSLCLEDLAPVALGSYIRAMISCIDQAETATHSAANTSLEHLQEKIFTFFIEHGNLWSDMCNLPEFRGPELSESRLSGYLYKYIQFLEENVRLEALDAIFEKMRKRFKNPKLSNTIYAKVCRYASIIWYRTILLTLVLNTPSHSHEAFETLNPDDDCSEKHHLLSIDLEMTDEFWNSSFDDSTRRKNLKIRWGPMLCNLKNVVVKKIPEENLETANCLLRCCYNLYRESSCVGPPMPSFGVSLCLVSVNGDKIERAGDGIETSDMTIPKKLLVWAYTLLHGRCANIHGIVKHCEENAKSRIKKGSSISCAAPSASTQVAVTKNTTGAGVDCGGISWGAVLSDGEKSSKPGKDIYVGKSILHYCTNSATEISDNFDNSNYNNNTNNNNNNSNHNDNINNNNNNSNNNNNNNNNRV